MTHPLPQATQDLLNLGLFWKTLKHYSFLFVVLPVIMLGLGLLYLRSTAVLYEATMLVGQKQDDGFGSASSSGLGSALLGSVLGGTQNVKVEQFTGLMQSRATAQHMINNTDVLQRLFGVPENAADWKPDDGFKTSLKTFLRDLAGRGPLPTPSADDVAEYLKTKITGETEAGKTLTRYSIKHPDPQTALWVLQTAYNTADSLSRDRRRKLYEQRIDFIASSLMTVEDVNQRRALLDNLRATQMALIIANSNESVAVEVLQSPIASNQPVSPRLGKTLGVFVVLGILLAMLITVLVYMRRTHKDVARLTVQPTPDIIHMPPPPQENGNASAA